MHELPTPAALVDLERVDANLRRMQQYADQHGLAVNVGRFAFAHFDQ